MPRKIKRIPDRRYYYHDVLLVVIVAAKIKIDVFLLSSIKVPIKVPFQLVDPSGCLEGRLAYWREDAGINLRHWNWYMVNPSQGYDEMLENYRRGEYFIYMYEQILAR